jgi:dienelactone hydrolase
MNETRIRYAAGSKNYVGALVPADLGPARAAVVLLPDWRGQSALALAHARHLASLGCLVAIADLYGDGFNPTHPDQVAPMVQHGVAGYSGSGLANAHHRGRDRRV